MNIYFIGNGQRKNSLPTNIILYCLEFNRKIVFQEGMVSLLQLGTEGRDYSLFQVHDILWNHSIIEEKKILLYSWHLPKSLPAWGGPSGLV